MMLLLTLPYPPSVNNYWRHYRGRTVISKQGQQYGDSVWAAVVEQRGRLQLTGRLSMNVSVFPPDRRRRDLDNILKAVLDALCKAGVYRDDEQIDELNLKRFQCEPNGRLVVSIDEVIKCQ